MIIFSVSKASEICIGLIYADVPISPQSGIGGPNCMGVPGGVIIILPKKKFLYPRACVDLYPLISKLLSVTVGIALLEESVVLSMSQITSVPLGVMPPENVTFVIAVEISNADNLETGIADCRNCITGG